MEEVDRILRSQALARQAEARPADSEVDASVEQLISADAADVLTRSEEVQQVKETLEEMPDVREDVVAALKAKIESGTYHVSSEEIADLMVRRAYADRIR
jgi:negative regulator of flagellin synthesis FlgM